MAPNMSPVLRDLAVWFQAITWLYIWIVYGPLSEILQIPDLTGTHGHKPDCVNQIWPLTAIRTTPFSHKGTVPTKKTASLVMYGNQWSIFAGFSVFKEPKLPPF